MVNQQKDDSSQLNRNDKEIFSSLMKEGEWFPTETVFGDPILFNYYTGLALAYGRYSTDPGRSMESVFNACKGEVERNVRRGVLCEPEDIFKRTRHYVRCRYPAPPFCFETPVDFSLESILAFLHASCNRATGLPMQHDLADQDITIPAGFTREFVEEIKARLVRDPDLDKYEFENHFASLNPKKKNRISQVQKTSTISCFLSSIHPFTGARIDERALENGALELTPPACWVDTSVAFHVWA